MNEWLRLDYLEAMGVVQYAARFPLPNALSSPVIEIEESFEDEIVAPTANSARAAMPESLRSILEKETALLTPPQPQEKSTAAPKTEITPAQTTASPLFRCQIAFWLIDDLLVIAETPRMDNKQLTLLRNILKAIGRPEQLANTHQFSWPLSQNKDKTLHAARDHFQGMLDGGALKNTAARQIICFGNTANTLLAHTDSGSTHTTQYRDWPIITVCALHEMLEQPSRKAETWRTLQILVRA